jgi:FMN phosphatase YigB (HAD superfamily)
MQGVLFDLDGTLLDVDIGSFLRSYFRALQTFAAPRFPDVEFLPAVIASIDAMQAPHGAEVNRDVFFRNLSERPGIDLGEAQNVFDEFYQEVFPALGDGYGAAAGATEAIGAARALGLKIAIATQPIFPRVAVEHRLSWAGFSPSDFDAITTFEIMHTYKPQAPYFLETCALIGCEPTGCVMIGDDPVNDMSAVTTGMRTFYVGSKPWTLAHGRGTLKDVPAFLKRLEG